MTVEQRLLQTLHALPAPRQQELLDFAEFLRSQAEQGPRETRRKLTPLPVLPGRMVPGWKDAVYGDDDWRVFEPEGIVLAGPPSVLAT